MSRSHEHESDERDGLSIVEVEALAEAFHEQYRVEQEGLKDVTDPAMRPWSGLAESLRNSNRDLAADVPRKLKTIGCRLGHGAPNPDFVFTSTDLEALAAEEHRRFVDERLAAGWTLGEKDLEAKTSPYLVEYAELAEEVKEWDRNAIRAIPGVLARAGLRIDCTSKPRVFVIRDFSTPDLEILIERAIELSADFLEWDVPGVTDEVPVDAIFTNVRSRIHSAHHVLACVNEPNANVGYEVGHALGRGARVSLFRAGRGAPPAWLERSPVESYGVAQVTRGEHLVDLVRFSVGSGQIPRQTRPALGDSIVVLAPLDGAASELANRLTELLIENERSALLVQEPEWNLDEAPARLQGARDVVLCFERPPSDDGDPGRDGGPNSVHAILAGYLNAATPGRRFLWQSKSTRRRLADFGGRIREFGSLKDARGLLIELLDE